MIEHIRGTESLESRIDDLEGELVMARKRIEQLEDDRKFIYEALQALASGAPLPNLKEELKGRLK